MAETMLYRTETHASGRDLKLDTYFNAARNAGITVLLSDANLKNDVLQQGGESAGVDCGLINKEQVQ